MLRRPPPLRRRRRSLCWSPLKAKTPDNRPKWQVIYHIQPFLAVYSCLCCCCLPVGWRRRGQPKTCQLFLHQRFQFQAAAVAAAAPCRPRRSIQSVVLPLPCWGAIHKWCQLFSLTIWYRPSPFEHSFHTYCILFATFFPFKKWWRHLWKTPASRNTYCIAGFFTLLVYIQSPLQTH